MRLLKQPSWVRFLAALLGIIAVLAGWWVWLRLTMPPRDTGSPTELTRGNIVAVLEAAEGYQDHNGHWPDPGNWAAVLRDSFQSPADREAFDRRVADGWGSPLHCSIIGIGQNSEFHCVSCGANRVDDHELGDDIVGVAKNGFLGITHGTPPD
jgi:hypothetical protein